MFSQQDARRNTYRRQCAHDAQVCPGAESSRLGVYHCIVTGEWSVDLQLRVPSGTFTCVIKDQDVALFHQKEGVSQVLIVPRLDGACE